jgi:hypothetical protein
MIAKSKGRSAGKGLVRGADEENVLHLDQHESVEELEMGTFFPLSVGIIESLNQNTCKLPAMNAENPAHFFKSNPENEISTFMKFV